MPFDGAGNASIVNSFTPSTVISSSQVNANFTDIATMLTNTLPRDGQAAMTGQLKATDGLVSAPGITFGSDADNGFYRTGSNAWSASVGNAQTIAFGASGTTFVKPLVLTKGADVASASPLVLVADGNYFDVTGTTGFSQITCPVGSLFILQFDGALTMTDGANLDLGGNNITTAAGDRALFFAHTANTAQLIAYRKEGQSPLLLDEDNMASDSAAHAPTQQSTKAYVDTAVAAAPQKLVQRVYATYTTQTNTTNTIPNDTSIPQIGEGAESVTAAITPTSASNRIRVTCSIPVSGNASGFVAVFLCQNGVSDALAVVGAQVANNILNTVPLVYEASAASTSARTYSLRYGPDASSLTTGYVNRTSGTALYGGAVVYASMIIEEIVP